MSDAALFIALFILLFVFRVIAATIFYALLLPEGDACPLCDSATIRVQSGRVLRCFPMFASRWCLNCGWHGVLRALPSRSNRG